MEKVSTSSESIGMGGHTTQPADAGPREIPVSPLLNEYTLELIDPHFDHAYVLGRYEDELASLGYDLSDRGQALLAYLSQAGIRQLNPSRKFSEGGYLESNPDVAKAVRSGSFLCGFHHFLLHGRLEDREGWDRGDPEPRARASSQQGTRAAGFAFNGSGYRGMIESATADLVSGWIAGTDRTAPAQCLTFFENERYLGSTSVEEPRPDSEGMIQRFAWRPPDSLQESSSVQIRLAGHFEDLLSQPLSIGSAASPDNRGAIPLPKTNPLSIGSGTPPDSHNAVPLPRTQSSRPPSIGGESSSDNRNTVALPTTRFSEVQQSSHPIRGRVEREFDGIVTGWAVHAEGASEPVQLEVVEAGRTLAVLTASMFRPDLATQGMGDGYHGFAIDVANLLKDSEQHALTFRVLGTEWLLQNGITVGPFGIDGIVRVRDYLDDPQQLELLTLPFEHYVYDLQKLRPARAQRRLANRLKRERMLIEARESRSEKPTAIAVLLCGHSRAMADLAVNLRLWAIQSDPNVTSVVIGDADSSPHGTIVCSQDDLKQLKESLQRAEWCVFARPGDMLHPSTSYILSTIAEDVMTWNIFRPSDGVVEGRLSRRPVPDRATIWHNPSLDTAFAVRSRLLADCPDDVLVALARGNVHLLLCWLDAVHSPRWHQHIEALTSRGGQEIGSLDLSVLRDDIGVYRRIALENLPDFSLEDVRSDVAMPFVLVPLKRAARTSVVICYHDSAAMTLRTVQSLARQNLTGSLEVVLVNNRSSEEESKRVVNGAVKILGAQSVIALDYPKPFNHSEQNNLGVEAATGEVVFICNNDAFLHDATVLEQLGAWALQPGIGTVGCALVDSRAKTGSFGHKALPLADHIAAPVFGENKDFDYAGTIHSCSGNTLAFAGMARDRFRALGGLDAVRFPIGYNDVEFMLRASREGLVHLYIGHLYGEHQRGSSRSGDNEDLQLIWIHQLYPDLLRQRFSQLIVERIVAREASGRNSAVSGDFQDILELLSRTMAAQEQSEKHRGSLSLQLSEIEQAFSDLNDGKDPRIDHGLNLVRQLLADTLSS